MKEEPHSRTILWIREVPKVAGVLVVFWGAMILLGWVLNFQVLTRLFPGQTSMRPNSAAAYILAGMALWLLQKRQGGRSLRLRQRMGKSCAVLVVALGVLTLSEYLISINLGIDHLFFRDLQMPIVGLAPGRMTPIGALSLVFLGCSFLALGWGKKSGPQPAELFALAVIFDGMLGLLDYILHPQLTLMGVAPSSSLVLCVLGAGILTAHSDHQFRKVLESNHTGGAAFRRLLPVAVIVPLALAALVGE